MWFVQILKMIYPDDGNFIDDLYTLRRPQTWLENPRTSHGGSVRWENPVIDGYGATIIPIIIPEKPSSTIQFLVNPINYSIQYPLLSMIHHY